MSETPLTIEEIHRGTLEILKKIIKICDEIGINYFLAYGSLIGAVRHKGFIPWDDDCDIIMTRPEYEKFLLYCEDNQEQIKPFKLMNRHNTENYPFTISRFCDTRYRMECDGYPDAGMGMFIDIYPYDGAGNKKKSITKSYETIMKKIYLTFNGIALQPEYTPSKRGRIISIIKYFCYFYARKKGSSYFLDKLDNLQYRYPYSESKYLSCITWDSMFITFDKKYFENYIYMYFENIKVKVPAEYDSVLRMIYGDYMRLPPENERIATHNYRLYRK